MLCFGLFLGVLPALLALAGVIAAHVRERIAEGVFAAVTSRCCDCSCAVFVCSLHCAHANLFFFTINVQLYTLHQ
jgi:hypothetical protein